MVGSVPLDEPLRVSYDSTRDDTAELRRLFSFGNRIVEAEELFHPRDFQGLMDALVDSHQAERAAIFLPAHVGSDKRADAGLVDQRHSGEVEDEGPGSIGANG